MKKVAKSIVRTLLHEGGGLHDVRFWNRNAFRILMYHDFPAIPGMEKALAKQFEHINRFYHVVTMSEIATHLREGSPLPKNALAVTIDDGGRDFLLSAYPVFKAYKIPVTLYLVSGFLDKKLWLWWDQVELLIKESHLMSFHLPLSPGARPIKFVIETPAQREQVIDLVKEEMKKLREEERLRLMHELPGILDAELPRDPPPHMEPLDWSEVRQLSKDGIEIGAHTVTHPILSRISNYDELLAEIGGSKKRIEEELQTPVKHFCFPYGRLGHFNEETVRAVEQCQFDTAVTAEWGLNTQGANPFKLLRLAADPTLPEHYFQEALAGAHPQMIRGQ